jgi:hypothetical protein
VQSLDPSTGAVVAATVLKTLRHDAGTYPDALVKLNGAVLVTGNHPLLANGGRVRADELTLGDTIAAIDDTGHGWTDRVRSVESLPAGVPVFDLRVGYPGTFVAGRIVVWIKE